MGNNCNCVLKKEKDGEVPTESHMTNEKDTTTVLRYLNALKATRRSEVYKNAINHKISQIVNHFEICKEEELKDFFDFQKRLMEVIIKSKERFNRLKVEHFGLFDMESLLDIDNKFISFTRDNVCNYHCYNICEENALRKRYIKFL